MSLASTLRTLVLLDPVVLELVSSPAEDPRVFPGQVPQNEDRPSLVYQHIAGQPEQEHEGLANLESRFYQLDAWAAGLGADDVSEVLGIAARNALVKRAPGFVGDGCVLDSVEVLNERHEKGAGYETEDDPAWRYGVDVRVWFLRLNAA